MRRRKLNPARAVGALPTLAATIGLVAIETTVFWYVFDHDLVGLPMLYLLGVVLVALRSTYAASLFTTILSVAAYDYFFTAPYFSFAVADRSFLLTFAIMVFVASVISRLTARMRHDAADATAREIRTTKLYAMTRMLASAPSSQEVRNVSALHLHQVFASDVYILVTNRTTGKVVATSTPSGRELSAATLVRVAEVATQSATDGVGKSSTQPPDEELVPLRASTGTVGVLVVHPSFPGYFANTAHRSLLDAFASQIAMALERANLAEDAHLAQIDVQNERLRNALLSSVSHDLRTPLAVVKGAVTALLDGEATLAAERRREYLQTISDEATRLNLLVRNLLDATSLEAGAVRVRRQWHLMEELVGVALNRLDEQLAHRVVQVRIAEDATLAPVDDILIEQVLVNLVENAAKYSPSGTPITIDAKRVDGGVEVAVTDAGPGVPTGQEELVFDKFHRATRAPGGMGLGLTICRGIVKAHGGTIWCENREEGGATFRFRLPCQEPPAMNSLPELAD